MSNTTLPRRLFFFSCSFVVLWLVLFSTWYYVYQFASQCTHVYNQHRLKTAWRVSIDQ